MMMQVVTTFCFRAVRIIFRSVRVERSMLLSASRNVSRACSICSRCPRRSVRMSAPMDSVCSASWCDACSRSTPDSSRAVPCRSCCRCSRAVPPSPSSAPSAPASSGSYVVLRAEFCHHDNFRGQRQKCTRKGDELARTISRHSWSILVLASRNFTW